MKLKPQLVGLLLGLILGSVAWGLTPKHPQQHMGPLAPLKDDGVGPLPPPDCVPYPDPVFGCK